MESAHVGRVGDAHARSKIVARRGKRVGHAGIAGKDQPLRRAGKDHRLLAFDQRLQLVKFFVPGANPVPAHAVVDGESVGGLPTVLRKRGQVEIAVVEVAGLALRIAGGDAQQEVGEVYAGFRAVEGEAAVEDDVGMRIDLVRRGSRRRT